MRRLSPSERALAQAVFGDAIRLHRVRIARGPQRFAVTLGSTIVFPHAAPDDFANAALHDRAWFVHELVHVWQFQTRPAWTLASWATTAAAGGYGPGLPGYGYAHPFEWAQLNLEQQARVVEHAWLLREGGSHGDDTLADYASRTPFEALTRET